MRLLGSSQGISLGSKGLQIQIQSCRPARIQLLEAVRIYGRCEVVIDDLHGWMLAEGSHSAAAAAVVVAPMF